VGESTGTKIGWAIGGGIVVLLGALAYDALRPADMDEERPPIIVRGGSLIFQSGDDTSNGKPWIAVDQDWQPDHVAGNKTRWFTVSLSAGNQQACPALAMTKEITIRYQPAQGAAVQFTVTMKGRPQYPNAPAPTIVGTGLAVGNPNTQLVHDPNGRGKITSVEFRAHGQGPVNCPEPTSVTIWQFQ
jgi:hypothetical protein